MKIKSLLAFALLLAVIACAFILRGRRRDYNVFISVPEILYSHENVLELNAVNNSKSDISLTVCLLSSEGEVVVRVCLEPGTFVGSIELSQELPDGSNMFIMRVLAELNHRSVVVDEKWVLVVKEDT